MLTFFVIPFFHCVYNFLFFKVVELQKKIHDLEMKEFRFQQILHDTAIKAKKATSKLNIYAILNFKLILHKSQFLNTEI